MCLSGLVTVLALSGVGEPGGEKKRMFMRNNRAKNGAVQPEKTAAADASTQRSARKLSPNGPIPSDPEDWRFNPQMSTCAQINEDHYQAGIGGRHPYDGDYESKIPSVGTIVAHTEGDRGLKSR